MARLRMGSLMIDENLVDDLDMIYHHVVDYYSSLYNGSSSSMNSNEIDISFHYLVTSNENSMLNKVFNNAEIKERVFSIDPCGVLGPNGFSQAFFQSCYVETLLVRTLSVFSNTFSSTHGFIQILTSTPSP